MQIAHQPMRGVNILERIYVSCPHHSIFNVVSSIVGSDHKAVIDCFEQCQYTVINITVRRTYRRKSPAQNAAFLREAASVNSGCDDPDIDTQTTFNKFNQVTIGPLITYYPECTVTMTSREPSYITPGFEAQRPHKSRLMMVGRTEEAGALAKQIGKEISKHSKTKLRMVAGSTDAKEMWSVVRQLRL
jgi:hypothetical protein